MRKSSVLQSSLLKAVKKKLEYMGISPSARILVGVSGGVDSMVLLTLLKQINSGTAAAHINFQLRGTESDEDASLVRSFCAEHNIQYLELAQDTKKYAAAHKLNAQSAAREIRYKWWSTLLKNSTCDWVATAHHQDDNTETFFLNLMRGTGIKGLLGIPVKRDSFIRPMIDISRADIEEFALAHEIPFRTDRSNESDDYQRNRIRHHLIPLLRELNPDLNAVMRNEKRRMEIEWKAWEAGYQKWLQNNLIPHQKGFKIKVDISEQAYVLKWLEEKNIPWQLAYDFTSSSQANSGKELSYGQYTLSRTVDGYYFEKGEKFQSILIHSPGTFHIEDDILTIERVPSTAFVMNPDPGIEYADFNNISWPLEVCEVSAGDHFQPLGMKGKNKKIQDYLVDIKLDTHDKKKVRILKSKEHIVWLVGMRLDERVKVNPGAKELFRLKIEQAKDEIS